MRNAVTFLTGNQILNAAIIGWALAQILKFVICLVIYKKIDFKRILGSGGMPSSHSAMVTAVATMTGAVAGFGSVSFGIATVMAIVIMYDAAGVRRAAGEQAKILNYIMNNWNSSDPKLFEKSLKELLGHTPVEVFAGAGLGIIVSLILIWVSQ